MCKYGNNSNTYFLSICIGIKGKNWKHKFKKKNNLFSGKARNFDMWVVKNIL